MLCPRESGRGDLNPRPPRPERVPPGFLTSVFVSTIAATQEELFGFSMGTSCRGAGTQFYNILDNYPTVKGTSGWGCVLNLYARHYFGACRLIHWKHVSLPNLQRRKWADRPIVDVCAGG